MYKTVFLIYKRKTVLNSIVIYKNVIFEYINNLKTFILILLITKLPEIGNPYENTCHMMDSDTVAVVV